MRNVGLFFNCVLFTIFFESVGGASECTRVVGYLIVSLCGMVSRILMREMTNHKALCDLFTNQGRHHHRSWGGGVGVMHLHICQISVCLLHGPPTFQ